MSTNPIHQSLGKHHRSIVREVGSRYRAGVVCETLLSKEAAIDEAERMLAAVEMYDRIRPT